ncbi:hypothetical protein RB595_003529 [Gaeumannomyces hyphopodioides]
MSATQGPEAESAVDHTAKGLYVGIQGLSLGPKPVANEAAQTQTGSSRAPVRAAAVDPARPPSPSTSVAHLANPFPHERASIVSPGNRQIDGKKGTAAPIMIPGPRNSASHTDDNDDQDFGCPPRTNTSTTVSTNTTGTPITSVTRSCTLSSLASMETDATSPHDAFGPNPKSVHWVPLATRETMPTGRGLREISIGAPKPLVSHSTFPLTPQELTARAASVSSPRLLGSSPVLGKGIGDASGPKDLPIRTPPLAQLRMPLTLSRMMKAGLSGAAEPENRVIQFVQDQESWSQILRDTTEPGVAVEGGGTFSKHTVSSSATQPHTPERPKTSQGASTSTPESEDSPTPQLTPITSDSDSDQGVDGGVMCEELGENSQDQFTRKIYAVIQQHTPGSVLDELDKPLKELANRCVERAANLAQASLNKRASAIVAAATFSGGSLPYSTESSPCDASSSSHPADAGGGSGSFGQGQERVNHRKRRKGSLDGSSDKDSSSQGDGSGKDGKKTGMAGTPPKGKLLSCPYRTRNPLRFNVRDYESCATQGHADMARLKRHIKNYHSLKEENQCARCKVVFKTGEELSEHQTQKNWWCDVREDVANTDPEGGITKDIEERMIGRKKGSKVDTWEALWVLLFPGDTPVPRSDFVPVVELFEVWHEFHLDGGVPPLISRENVENKFKRCIEDPTKVRKNDGNTHLSIIEAAGAPAGTAPLGYSGPRQQARPDLTPAIPCSSNQPFSSPTANGERNGSSKRRRPQGFPPVGSGGPPPSKHIEISNLPSQSSSSYPLLAPRPGVTARAKEVAASSTVQRIPSNPATGSQSHNNGMGHNNTNRGPDFVSSGIASQGFSSSGNVTNGWLKDNSSPMGVRKILSPVAAGKQPERMLTRRQSSSAGTAIYNPDTAPPQEREQQQVGLFTSGMNYGEYDAETGLLVSHTGGGVPDGPYNNPAMCSASQVLGATIAPDTIAPMTGGSYPPFHMTADYGGPYAPMDSTAALANLTAGYMCPGTASMCEGDVDLGGMSQSMPTNDQSGAYIHAQTQDDGMESIFQLGNETGTMPPGPHGEDKFQSLG